MIFKRQLDDHSDVQVPELPNNHSDLIQTDEWLAKVLDEAIELAELGGLAIPSHKIAERVFEKRSRKGG